jgi:hypothetical protein
MTSDHSRRISTDQILAKLARIWLFVPESGDYCQIPASITRIWPISLESSRTRPNSCETSWNVAIAAEFHPPSPEFGNNI